MFSMVKEHHLTTIFSDHASLFFNIDSNQPIESRGRRTFHFENLWGWHIGCKEVIEGMWKRNQVANFDEFVEEVSQCGNLLSKWNREVFGHIQANISKKERELQNLLNNVTDTDIGGEIKQCRKELSELVMMEEIMWKHRSKNIWLKEWDRNTRFFHEVAFRRRRNNKILRINDDGDCWHENAEGVEKVFGDYFKAIFTTSNPAYIDHILQSINSKVIANMNHVLDKEVTKEEIKMALDQMSPHKTPGPDVIIAYFYKKILGYHGARYM